MENTYNGCAILACPTCGGSLFYTGTLTVVGTDVPGELQSALTYVCQTPGHSFLVASTPEIDPEYEQHKPRRRTSPPPYPGKWDENGRGLW